MKFFLIFFIILGALLESTVISFPVMLIVIVTLSTYAEENVFLWAFLAGFLLDILTLRTLGVDSLFFLASSMVVVRYKKILHPGRFLYQLAYLLIVYSLYSFIFYRQLTVPGIVSAGIFGVVLLILFERLFAFENKRKLTV